MKASACLEDSRELVCVEESIVLSVNAEIFNKQEKEAEIDNVANDGLQSSFYLLLRLFFLFDTKSIFSSVRHDPL